VRLTVRGDLSRAERAARKDPADASLTIWWRQLNKRPLERSGSPPASLLKSRAFSVPLGTAADAYEIMTAAGTDHPDKEHVTSLIFAAITKNVLNRTALQGIRI
jgi:hypothetical protein